MLHFYTDEYLTYCKNLHYADNSVKEMLRYVNDFNDFLIENQVSDRSTDRSYKSTDLNDISQVKYIHLFNYVTSKPSSPHTVKARIWALKKYFNFLYLHEYIKDNISQHLSPPKIPKKETAFLTADELKIVFEYLAKNIIRTNGLRDFLIILLMATLGLRKSSTVSLNIEDIDVINQRIFIEEKGSKGKRPVVIPLGLLMLFEEYILKNILQEEPLFVSRDKKRLRTDAVDKIVRRIKNSLLNEGHKFAGNLHPHIFRHSAAAELNNVAGFNITREMLGHRNEQNTRKYIHLSPTSYGAYMKKHPYFLNERLVLSVDEGSQA
jgi:integrase/recombinase XerC